MKDRFKGWRGKCGLAALLPALFFTAAWAKTAVDHYAFGVPYRFAPEAPVTVGRILISGISDAASGTPAGPLRNWNIHGLFADACVIIQPATKPRPADEVVQTFGSTTLPGMQANESGVIVIDATPASYWEAAEEANAIIQAAGGSTELPQPQGSFQVDPSDADDGGFKQDHGKIKSQLSFCGIEFEEREGGDLGYEMGLDIPHWTIVLPCALAATALLLSSRKSRAKVDVAVGPPASVVPTQSRTYSFFTGWRPKLGAVTLLTSLVLAGGWIRSLVVTDSLHFDVAEVCSLRLHSSGDGLVFERYLDPDYVGSGFFFRTRTGEVHSRMTFRPRLPWEAPEPANYPLPLQQFGSTTLPSGQPNQSPEVQSPMTGNPNLVAGDAGPALSGTGDLSETTPEEAPRELLTSASDSNGATTTASTSATPIGLENAATSVENPRWIDMVIYYGGFYLSYSPYSSSRLVIPYAYPTIPLTIVSGWLLLRRRSRPRPSSPVASL